MEEPNLTNTPEDKRLTDTGILRYNLLNKDESSYIDVHELSDKSTPVMFTEDWKPTVKDSELTIKSAEEVLSEIQEEENKKILKQLKLEEEKSKEFLYLFWCLYRYCSNNNYCSND